MFILSLPLGCHAAMNAHLGVLCRPRGFMSLLLQVDGGDALHTGRNLRDPDEALAPLPHGVPARQPGHSGRSTAGTKSNGSSAGASLDGC